MLVYVTKKVLFWLPHFLDKAFSPAVLLLRGVLLLKLLNKAGGLKSKSE